MRARAWLVLLALAPTCAGAASASEDAYSRRVVLDDEHVLMRENTIPPGAISPEHGHRWGRAIYVIAGGSLELLAADGGSRRLEIEPGQGLWREPEIHRVRNVGETTIRILEIEVKAPSPAAAAHDQRGRRSLKTR